MSTLDKINNELSVLEKELSQLHHYTNEIGNAKDAAKSVINMSLSFLKDFQEKVATINKQMDIAVKDFKKNVDKTSDTLDTAANAFHQGIGEAKRALDGIGSQLAKAAQNVNDLTTRIEAINILGHFTKIHECLLEVRRNIETAHTKTEKILVNMEETQKQRHKELKRIQITGMASIVISILIFVVVVLLRR